MKKTLIALAAVAATAAYAQSSVELYGIVDLGYHNEKAKDSAGNSAKRQGLASVVNGSRIGFRGTEDLGGGLKAGFTLEYGITPDENTGLGNAAGATNRQSFVSLSGGFGDVRLGRQVSLHHSNQGAGDLLGNLNAQAGYIGGLDSLVRVSNAFRYTSPSFNGFTVAVQKGFGETITNADAAAPSTTVNYGDEKLNEQQALRLNYAAGPLAVGFATETMKNWALPAVAVTSPGIFPGAQNILNADFNPTNGTAAVIVDKRRANNLYATYDLGVAKLGFVNNNTKFSWDSGDSVKWTANTLTVAVPLDAITLHASVGSGKFKADGETVLKASGYQLGGMYALSKRTSAYAYTGQTKFKADGYSTKYNTYSVGIRHTF